MKTSGSLGKRCWRKGGRGGSSPKQLKQNATRTCKSTGTRAATPNSTPSGTSGALTSVATTGGMSLSAQPPLRQHRPPRPRSPVSEGLRRSNRRRTTTYRPNNNDDDDSDPDDVDDKKDEDYVPDDDDDSDPDEDLNDYVSDPDDLNDSEPDEDLNDYVPDPDDDDETTELLTKDEQRRRRNAIKKARYKARYPEKARARNIRKKADYRRKYPEKVRAARKRYVEKYPDRVQESRRRYEETHKEERRAAKKQWARNNRARCTESDRRYKEKHRERIRLRDREYRQKNCVRIAEYQRKYYGTEKGWAIRRGYRAANREKLLAQAREYYWANREKILEKSKRYYNKRKDVPRPKPRRVVLTNGRAQPSLESYLNDFCASLPSVERQKTDEKIKALGPLKLTILLEDFIKSIPKTFENISFCESFLEDYTLTDMDSGDVQVMDPSDLEDVSSLLQGVSPDEWTELLRDVEDSCSFDLEALVPPEDFVHDMSPDEGVDLLYDLVT